MRPTLLSVLLVASVLLSACTKPEPRPEPLTPEAIPAGVQVGAVDKPAPAFRLPQLEGDSLSFSDFEGDVLVINFWATWCAPCRAEIPDLIDLHEELNPEGFQVIGIMLEEEDLELAKSFSAELGINYPILMDNDGAVARAFGGVNSLPATFVVDREGIVTNVVYGLFPVHSMRPKLETLIAAG